MIHITNISLTAELQNIDLDPSIKYTVIGEMQHSEWMKWFPLKLHLEQKGPIFSKSNFLIVV